MLPDRWPTTWQGSLRLLKENGYRGPKKLFVFLSDDHPSVYSIVYSSDKECHMKGLKCNFAEKAKVRFASSCPKSLSQQF